MVRTSERMSLRMPRLPWNGPDGAGPCPRYNSLRPDRQVAPANELTAGAADQSDDRTHDPLRLGGRHVVTDAVELEDQRCVT
jgi:hypothetical protein